MRKRNRLWKPERADNCGNQAAPRRPPTDGVCMTCLNRPTCQNTCAPMLWVNGNVVLKETLLDEPVEPSSDYNAILAEGIDTHRRDFSEHIDRVKNTKVKCVAILAEAGIKIEDIAKVMKCAKRTIYRIRDNDGE